MDYLAVFVILLTAYFVRGLTGFGSGLISVPLLALWQPLQLVVPLIMHESLLGFVVLSQPRSRIVLDW